MATRLDRNHACLVVGRIAQRGQIDIRDMELLAKALDINPDVVAHWREAMLRNSGAERAA